MTIILQNNFWQILQPKVAKSAKGIPKVYIKEMGTAIFSYKIPFWGRQSDNHTPVLVPVPMAHEYLALTTLQRVFRTDTKTANKQEVVQTLFLKMIFLCHILFDV